MFENHKSFLKLHHPKPNTKKRRTELLSYFWGDLIRWGWCFQTHQEKRKMKNNVDRKYWFSCRRFLWNLQFLHRIMNIIKQFKTFNLFMLTMFDSIREIWISIFRLFSFFLLFVRFWTIFPNFPSTHFLSIKFSLTFHIFMLFD